MVGHLEMADYHSERGKTIVVGCAKVNPVAVGLRRDETNALVPATFPPVFFLTREQQQRRDDRSVVTPVRQHTYYVGHSFFWLGRVFSVDVNEDRFDAFS